MAGLDLWPWGGGRGAPAIGGSACGPLLSPGLSLDRSRLHLLYQAPPTDTWADITAEVALELTHLYTRFQVTHFSWSVSPPAPSLPSPPAPCAQPQLTPALPGTGSGTAPRPASGAWHGRPGRGCGCTASTSSHCRGGGTPSRSCCSACPATRCGPGRGPGRGQRGGGARRWALSPGVPAGGRHPAAAAGAVPRPRALRHCGDV